MKTYLITGGDGFIGSNFIHYMNYALFHCTCKGECTWYELTKEIFRLKGINTKVLPCSTEEFKLLAKNMIQLEKMP
ncbi:hypothetical protein [Clostridium sp.]|jgi:dTDP-4-dehydrorhamnose reductase|uniref:hypothetical protein n=1 Tax=Clostridium sp. TaxID=1506 RepID=UPI003EECFD24